MGRTRAAIREHVIDCATRLFSERGFENVPFNDLSEVSGVDKATITRNFGTAEGLYNAVVERFAAVHLDSAKLESYLAQAGDDDVLLILLTYYYECFFEHIHYLRLYFMENHDQGSRRLDWPLVDEMRAVLASSIQKKDIKTLDDTVATASGLLIDFVAKCVWQANVVDGHWKSTDLLKQGFATHVQPYIDVCLLTLLPD